jgi:outer membrane lipoprotein carrier protein
MVKVCKSFLYIVLPLLVFNNTMYAQSTIHQLESTIKQLQPFNGRFVQEYFDAFQEKKASASGVFSFMQPGLMKWSYEEPEQLLFIVGRDKAWLYDPILENVTVQALDKVSGIQSLKFLSDKENISRHFVEIKPQSIFIDRKQGPEVVFLSPVEKNQSLAELQLVYNSKTQRIHQFVLIDQNRNYRKITLTGVTIDHDLKESDFEFIITQDMEVIQGFGN